MLLATWLIALTSALFAFGAVLTFFLAWKSGQLNDSDEAAKRMIEEREPAPWTGPGEGR